MTKVVLATSNGTGMGHLTRQAAIALAIGSEHSPTLFSLSVGLPLATGLGINGEYCPSYDQPWVAGRAWHGYLRDRLVAFVEETEAKALLFDGVAVYP
ncbi:MAG TPA: UDP-N-acetylglucosamine--LPS N-acetylglucosamine transferase, partial [Acidimicrobiia bacterium]